MEYTVIHNKTDKRFEIHLDGKVAFEQYELFEGGIAYTHTEVPDELAGKGLAAYIAKYVLDYAQEHQLKVKPYCPYINAYINKHPEYQSNSLFHNKKTIMKTKKIEAVLAPPPAHMVGDGFRVHNFIPYGRGMSMERMSPFIMMDYNSKYYFPPTNELRGVGVHPHRGFETVTIAYKGKVAHHDSSGNSGVIGEGDVQWMTAASGILHKEYHEQQFSKEGGDFQMVQLWVNLPAKDKMSKPKYQGILNSEITKHQLPNNDGIIEVIAGEYNGTVGAASTFTNVHLFNAKLKKDAAATFSFPAHYNTALLVIEGSIRVNDSENVMQDNFLLFANEGEEFVVKASEDAIVLILSGEPIDEPIVSHGPFVMNTQEEIIQAFNDVNMGKFGFLE